MDQILHETAQSQKSMHKPVKRQIKLGVERINGPSHLSLTRLQPQHCIPQYKISVEFYRDSEESLYLVKKASPRKIECFYSSIADMLSLSKNNTQVPIRSLHNHLSCLYLQLTSSSVTFLRYHTEGWNSAFIVSFLWNRNCLKLGLTLCTVMCNSSQTVGQG